MSKINLIYLFNDCRLLLATDPGEKYDDEEIIKSLNRIVSKKPDSALIKPYRSYKEDKNPGDWQKQKVSKL